MLGAGGGRWRFDGWRFGTRGVEYGGVRRNLVCRIWCGRAHCGFLSEKKLMALLIMGAGAIYASGPRALAVRKRQRKTNEGSVTQIMAVDIHTRPNETVLTTRAQYSS